MHGLAGAIGAAVAIEEGFHRALGGAAAVAALGQVERRAVEGEEGEIVAEPRADEGGAIAAEAAQQAGGEACPAVAVGLCLAEHGVVAGDQLQRHRGQRLGAGQRAQLHLHAGAAGIGGDAEIGDHQPLGRPILPIGLRHLGGLGGEHVDSGGHRIDQVGERNPRRHLAVGGAVDGDLAAPHRRPQVLGHRLRRPGVEALGEQALEQQAGDVALGNPHQLEGEPRNIDRFQGNRHRPGARQDVGGAREQHRLRAVADRQAHRLVLAQAASVGGGKPGADGDLGRGAVDEAGEAQPRLLRRHLGPLARRHRHVVGRRQRQRPRQRAVEGHAGPGHRAVGIDLLTGDAEVVGGHRLAEREQRGDGERGETACRGMHGGFLYSSSSQRCRHHGSSGSRARIAAASWPDAAMRSRMSAIDQPVSVASCRASFSKRSGRLCR